MRLIGHLKDEPSARTFGDYLLVNGIENLVEADHSAGWAIWISEEDKINTASQLLKEFEANPGNDRYRQKAQGASTLRAEKQQEQARWEKKVRGRREMIRPMLAGGLEPVTMGLMIVSALVYVLMLVNKGPWVNYLFITTLDPSLPEVRHGQIWRLVTPIFVHGGILHILFNMLWLRDLGSMIEARRGSGYLGLLVLGLAVGSNFAQLYIGGSPFFGGMSGVVYGLLGYIWIRAKFDPGCGYFIHPMTLMFMLIWFAAAFVGAVRNVANWAHAGGLLLGMAWGYFSAMRR